MGINLHRPSGILLGLCLGGVLMGAPAGFICAANWNPTAAAIFQILSAICLLLAAVSFLINMQAEKKNKKDLTSKQMLRIMILLMALAILVLTIMQLLAERVRF